MFARPRPKKVLVPPPKKRRRQHTVEEIKFDDDARAEYLTGFHKRKLQRIKHAKEQAAEQARLEKIEARKQIREERKREVEEHVASVNNALKEAAVAGYIEGEEDESSDNKAGEEWGGFQDTPIVEDIVDHEEEYIDEDRFTTVTVESVSVTKDGLTSSRPDEEDSANEEAIEKETTEKEPEKKRRPEKDRPGTKKKQKFRYETKLERQITNIKQKSKNKRRSRD